MNLTEWLVIIGFFGYVLLSGAKLYNIFSLGQFLELKKSFLVFIGLIISYLVLFLAVLYNVEVLIYISLFQFVTWYFIVNVLFMMIEIFFYLKDLPSKRDRGY